MSADTEELWAPIISPPDLSTYTGFYDEEHESFTLSLSAPEALVPPASLSLVAEISTQEEFRATLESASAYASGAFTGIGISASSAVDTAPLLWIGRTSDGNLEMVHRSLAGAASSVQTLLFPGLPTSFKIQRDNSSLALWVADELEQWHFIGYYYVDLSSAPALAGMVIVSPVAHEPVEATFTDVYVGEYEEFTPSSNLVEKDSPDAFFPPVAGLSFSDSNVLSQAGNLLDGDLDSRIAMEGIGQWIEIDLGRAAWIEGLRLAWFRGDERVAHCSVQISSDGWNWQTVWQGDSSGDSLLPETYAFGPYHGRFLRIVNQGNSENAWISLSSLQVLLAAVWTFEDPEPHLYSRLTPSEINASSFQSPNYPANVDDQSGLTRWAADGLGEWISFTFAEQMTIRAVDLAFFNGQHRVADFSIESSSDGQHWELVASFSSSGLTSSPEGFLLPEPVNSRYLRLVNHGNSSNNWISLFQVNWRGNPLPWITRNWEQFTLTDIGQINGPGSLVLADPLLGWFSFESWGFDLTGQEDRLQFWAIPAEQDGVFTATLSHIDFTHANAKAGLMLRSSLQSDAPALSVYGTPRPRTRSAYRATPNASPTYSPDLNIGQHPHLKLVRYANGTRAATFYSIDQVVWHLLLDVEISSQNDGWLGFFVGSRQNNQSNTSWFSQIDFIPADAMAPFSAPTGFSALPTDHLVELSWNPVHTGWGVVHYEVFRDGVLVGTTNNATPTFFDYNLSPETSYVYQVAAVDLDGAVSDLSAPLTVNTLPTSLPAGWQQETIGDVRSFAGGTFDSVDASYTINTGGIGFGGYTDGFHFLWQSMPSSEGVIRARVESVNNGHVRGGVMIRNNLSSSSAHGLMTLLSGANHASFHRRTASGNATWFGGLNGHFTVPVEAPLWVKAVRADDLIVGYISENGEDWEMVGLDLFTFSGDAHIGLAAGAQHGSQQGEVRFTDVQLLTGPDTEAPSIPTGLEIHGITDTSVDLVWEPATDNYGLFGYVIYRDGQEIGESLAPRFQDYELLPGTTHLYTVRSLDVAGNLSDPSSPLEVELPPSNLPSPWRHADVGPVETAGHAEALGDGFAVWSSGHDTSNRIDAFHYVYQHLEGDGEIIVRIAEYLEEEVIPGKAGIMIRENLTRASPKAFLYWSSQDQAGFQFGATQGTPRSTAGSTTATDGVWLRLTRQGNLFTAYTGNDGYGWNLLSSATVNMTSAIHVGFAVVGSAGFELREAVFDFPDVYTDGSSGVPSADDEQIEGFTQVFEGTGHSASILSGSWLSSGTSIFNNSRRGTVSYQLNVPEQGLYVLEIEGRARNGENIDLSYFDLLLDIDGARLGRHTLVSANGQPGTVQALTPWLMPSHATLTLEWDNVAPNRRLQIDYVRLLRIDGPDSNASGNPDWVDSFQNDFHGLDDGWTVSRVSPAFIEGQARFPSRVSLSSEDPVQIGVHRHWYANVPLDPTQPLPLTISFDHGGLTQSTSLTWEPTNVLHEETLIIRRHDALLLNAHPADAQPTDGTASITVDGDILTVSPGAPVSYVFDEDGTYTVEAQWNGAETLTGTLTVQVVSADFGDNPAAWTGRTRLWEVPGLPVEATLQPDNRIAILPSAELPDGGYAFDLTVDAPEDRRVLARLGENGPVLAAATVQGIQIYGASQTGAYFIDQFPDGTFLVETTVVQSRVLSDVVARLNIIVSGVSFDDGSGVKYLHPEDFDDLGMAKLRFIMPEGIKTSTCHRIRAYQNETHLGNF